MRLMTKVLVAYLVVLSNPVSLPTLATALADPAPTTANASPKPTAVLTIQIEGLRNDRGTVFVSLFENKKSFDDSKGGIQNAEARPKQGKAVVVFQNVVPGKYALSFIHDENDNKKLDTSFIGIPKEGFGYSKDVMGRFGPPKFDDAALVFPAGPTTVVMHAKYM